MPAVTNVGEGSIGNGSWQADGNLTGSDGQQHLIYVQGGQPGPFEAGGQTSYEAPGANPRLLFPAEQAVTLNDVVSISWDTKTSGSPDWFVDIFTRPDGVDDDAWYGKNFDLTANNAANTAAAGGFTRHTLDGSGGAVFDQAEFPPVDQLFSLDDLKSAYGDEELWFVAIGTGTNYDGFSGLLDNFQFEYTYEGQSFARQVDFEAAAVPLPSSLILLLGGAFALVGQRGLIRRYANRSTSAA